MRVFLAIALLFLIRTVHAQWPVYDCQSNTQVTQTIINGSPSPFLQQCVEFPDTQTFLFTGNSNKEIQANKTIKIEPGFKAEAFTSTGGMKLSITPASPVSIVSMNYADLTQVRKYDKFELGIALPASLQTQVDNYLQNAAVPANQKVNPFLEWKLRIVAEFKNEGYTYTYPVDGFYFRNFERDTVNDYWTDLGTPYPFRVRFAPHFGGNWTCTVKVYVNNWLTYTATPFTFTVVDAGFPGFVQVHSNGKNFRRGEDDDNYFYHVGQNLPFPGGGESEGMFYTGGTNYLQDYKMHYLSDYLDNIKTFEEDGGKYIRYIINPANSDVEWEKLGNYYDRLMFATETDNLLDYAHMNDMMIHFNLMLHTPIMKSADYFQDHWDFGYNDGDPATVASAYCYSKEFNTQMPSDMILNTTTLVEGHPAMDYVKQRYRYFIARYGYSMNIEFFELLSEPFHMNQDVVGGVSYVPCEEVSTSGDIARQAVTTFHTQLADYIKNHLQHKQHLIATQGRLYETGVYPMQDIDGMAFTVNETSWSNTNIDVATLSGYDANPSKLIKSKVNNGTSTDNNGFNSDEKSYAFAIHRIYEAYDKPSVFVETGSGDDTYSCSFFTSVPYDVMRLGFIGLAGFNMWEGWRYGDPEINPNHVDEDPEDFWPMIIRTAGHLNALGVRDVIGSDWVQGREVQDGADENDIREHQYYVSEDQTMAVGYVANRTYNIYTQRSLSDVTSTCYKCNDGISASNNPEFDDKYLIKKDIPYCHAMDPFCKMIELQGLLPNTDYKIEWFSYGPASDWMSEYCFATTNNGVHRVVHPILKANGSVSLSPVLWYVVTQQDCDSRMVGSNDQESVMQERVYTDKTEALALGIYPNPFSSEISIVSDEAIRTVAVYDNLGKLLLEKQFTDQLSVKLNTQGFGQGVYYVQINGAPDRYKVVKH